MREHLGNDQVGDDDLGTVHNDLVSSADRVVQGHSARVGAALLAAAFSYKSPIDVANSTGELRGNPTGDRTGPRLRAEPTQASARIASKVSQSQDCTPNNSVDGLVGKPVARVLRMAGAT